MAKKKVLQLSCVLCFGLLGMRTMALNAATIIDTDAVFGDTSPMAVDGLPFIVVDGADPPTVIDVVEPFDQLPSDTFFELRGASTLNLRGGSLTAFSGGPSVLATEQSTVNVTGGSAGGNGGITLRDRASVHVSAGGVGSLNEILGALNLHDSARGDLSGGGLGASEAPAVIMDGLSHFTLRNGLLAGGIRAKGMSTVDVYGGQIEPGEMTTWPLLDAMDEATINVFGTGLKFEPLPPELFPPESRRLSGLLADGSPVDIEVRGNIILHEIPEPSSILLATLASAAASACCTVRRTNV